jgi:hypothetical protein
MARIGTAKRIDRVHMVISLRFLRAIVRFVNESIALDTTGLVLVPTTRKKSRRSLHELEAQFSIQMCSSVASWGLGVNIGNPNSNTTAVAKQTATRIVSGTTEYSEGSQSCQDSV